MDHDGVTPIVTIPMSNGDHRAILNLVDFNELMAIKVSPIWRYMSGQVFETGAAKISIARLIMDAGLKQKVQHCNQNTLDMRRSNLVLAKGGGKYRARDRILNRDPAVLKEKIEIKPIYINPPHMNQIINNKDN